MKTLRRHIGLILVGGYAVLAAIEVWSEDHNADTPPIMALMVMLLGFVLLGGYLFSRLATGQMRRHQRRGFDVL